MALLVDVLLVHKNKLTLLVGIRTLLFSRLINSNLPLIKVTKCTVFPNQSLRTGPTQTFQITQLKSLNEKYMNMR